MATIIAVHGTFATGEETGDKWWQKNSECEKALREFVQGNATPLSYEQLIWDGDNSETSRRAAARRLLHRMSKLEAAGEPYVVIGHSHGGSVVAFALQLAARHGNALPHLRSWITVGTPFFASEQEAPVVRASRSAQQRHILHWCDPGGRHRRARVEPLRRQRRRRDEVAGPAGGSRGDVAGYCDGSGRSSRAVSMTGSCWPISTRRPSTARSEGDGCSSGIPTTRPFCCCAPCTIANPGLFPEAFAGPFIYSAGLYLLLPLLILVLASSSQLSSAYRIRTQAAAGRRDAGCPRTRRATGLAESSACARRLPRR